MGGDLGDAAGGQSRGEGRAWRRPAGEERDMVRSGRRGCWTKAEILGQDMIEPPGDRLGRIDPGDGPRRKLLKLRQQQRIMRAGEHDQSVRTPPFSTKLGAISAASAAASIGSPFMKASARPASLVEPTSVTSQWAA